MPLLIKSSTVAAGTQRDLEIPDGLTVVVECPQLSEIAKALESVAVAISGISVADRPSHVPDVGRREVPKILDEPAKEKEPKGRIEVPDDLFSDTQIISNFGA